LSNHTAAPSDVVVIGGGVIGLAVAWRACERGLRTTVLERGEPGGGTSRVAAGMLGPIAEAKSGEEPLLELGLASVRNYPGFVSELVRASGLDDVGYNPAGTLLVARDGDEAQALARELELRRRLGLSVERIRPSDARRLEPALTPALRLALDVSDDHSIDPRKLTGALVQAVSESGGEIRTGVEVTRLLLYDGRVEGAALANGEVVRAPRVVIAAGVWSGRIAGIPEQSRVPLRPVKGQILRLHDPAGPGLLTRVIRMEGAYIVPRGDGRYVIGGTMEERGFETTVTGGAVFELLRDALELVPGVSELVIDELSAGLRPGTPDNSPVIGASGVPGLYWATGHYRNGVLLAPITAAIVADALMGEEQSELAPAFGPNRFAAATAGSGAQVVSASQVVSAARGGSRARGGSGA
jgi:glycine oxidase